MTQQADSPPLWPLAVGFVALAAASFGVTHLVISDDGTASRAAGVVTISDTDSSVAASTTAVPDSAPATTPATGPATVPVGTADTTTVPVDPLAVLDKQRAVDFEQVESLVGQWVPQISAKRPGIEADGIVYQLPDIVALHQQLQAEYGALLLFSADYNYLAADLWVSIVPLGNADPAGALQFCFDQGIDRDNCFAKFITHDLSITDTVELQP